MLNKELIMLQWQKLSSNLIILYTKSLHTIIIYLTYIKAS